MGRCRFLSCFSDSSFLSHLASSFSSRPHIPATSQSPQFALCPWAQLLSLLHTCVWTSLFFCHDLLLLRAPHLSSARFLVWPIGLLPAPPTDRSTLFVPTYPPPACPYFFSASMAPPPAWSLLRKWKILTPVIRMVKQLTKRKLGSLITKREGILKFDFQ